MNRRQFIRLGAAGLAALAFGSPDLVPTSISASDSRTHGGYIHLAIREAVAEMVDLAPVPVWAFQERHLGPRVPGPAIFAAEGESLEIEISNQTGRQHAFAIQGVLRTDPVPAGRRLRFGLKAPAAGTYLYLDPLNAPVNRVMGLHGAFVVLPRTGNTPYSNPTTRMQALFNDLGTTSRFPGRPWVPGRTWIWLFNTIDPLKNKWASEHTGKKPLDPAGFLDGYLPSYFTINGKTGFFAAHSAEIMPSGTIGSPGLIRILNAGLATHSTHIHGNHVFLLSENGTPRENVILVDTWPMPPGSVKDVLHPFSRPPDIPPGAWPPSDEAFPFHYPVHCHVQMSQTASGGNYPQGLNVHWMLLPG